MSTRYNVLHVVDSFYPAIEFGGPIFSTKSLCDFIINDSSYKLTVITNNKLRPNSKLSLDTKSDIFINTTKRYNINWINYSKWYSEFVFIYKLVGLIKKSDLVHLTGIFNSCTFYTIIFTLIFNKKIIISPRGSIQALFEFDDVKKKKLKLLLLRFYSFMLISKKSFWLGTTEVENNYSNQMKKLKSFICVNPVDLPKFNIQRDKKNKFVICFISRLSEKKGVERFLKITSKLPRDKFEIIIAGTPENDKIYQKVLNYTKNFKNFNYYGLVSGSEKKEFYSKSDLFFFPSDSENFGIVIAEALSYGCSVLTSVKSPWGEHCEKGVLELFKLSDSTKVIIGKINDIYKLRNINNNLSFKCYSIIDKHYTYDCMIKQIGNTYRRII